MGTDSSSLAVLKQVVADGATRGLGQLTTEDDQLSGRTFTVRGRKVVNFGSCSYLGLERNPALIEGTIDAVRRFGTQFSSSRAYASVGLYEELEASLAALYSRPVLVTPTTTLGHLAALPVLVGERDAVILDLQVHASVQMAAQQLKARGIPLHLIRHNDMGALERSLVQFNARHERIWYMADGIYSMYGDSAPLEALTALLERHPRLRLYIDDAHGMSWAGPHGRGHVFARMGHHPRMVLAISLNKAFAAAGGCLVFPDQASADWVRSCGGTVIFSGPVQPPMLGAALASARLHLSGEIQEHQAQLQDRVAYARHRLKEAGLPQVMDNDAPLFFVPVGLPRTVYAIVERVLAAGFYVNPGVFPALPMRRGGIRFAINNHVTNRDIDGLVEVIAQSYVDVLGTEEISYEQVAKTFRIHPFQVKAAAHPAVGAPPPTSAERDLTVEHNRSIESIDPVDWDSCFAEDSCATHAALTRAEACFAGDEAEAGTWSFHYLTVRDPEGHVVLRGMYTAVRLKDDMFESATISEQVEDRRRLEPNYLTSKTVLLGTPVTKGRHLYLDRSHPAWPRALAHLVTRLERTQEDVGATRIMLRDFMGEVDEHLTKAMLDLGLIRVPLPDNHAIERLDWEDHADYMARLGRRYRSDLRREVLRHTAAFRVETGPLSASEVDHAYALYEQVYHRSFEINVYKLPLEYFKAIADNRAYDVIRLYLAEDSRPHRHPIAVMFSHFEGGAYHAMFVGFDSRFIESHNIYKQILYQTTMRARALDATRLDLAFTARLAKRKVGARAQPTFAFVRLSDHFNVSVLESMSRSLRSA